MLLDKKRGRKAISVAFVSLMAGTVIISVMYLVREQSPLSNWIHPDTESQCPSSHPVKAVFRNSIGAKCVYHFQGGTYYLSVTPERCYANIFDARRDGCLETRR